ncbi:MAG: ribosome silencing factor [Pseudomonadota bacterium]
MTASAPSPSEQCTLIVEALGDRKARDIVVFDVSSLTSITDFMIIASGTSDRHVKAIAEHVVSEFKRRGIGAQGVEGAGEGDWVLVDFADVIVHVMQPRVREFYNLEKLWGIDDEREPQLREGR